MTTPYARKGIWCISLGLGALLCATALSIALGSVRVPLVSAVQVLLHHTLGVTPGADTDGANASAAMYDQIVWQLRMPRTLAAALVGAALAPAGAMLQATVRNPLAEPGIIGISAGASLASVLAVSFGAAVGLPSAVTTGPLPAFAGSLLALLAILSLTAGGRTSGHRRRDRQSPVASGAGTSGPRIILAGVAVGQTALAATSFIQLQLTPAAASAILFWLLGSVAGVESASALLIPALITGVAIVAVMVRSRDLNIMSVGDEDAIALGVSPVRTRVFVILTVAALTGVAVSLAGTVGFLGLFVPHALRMVAGPDYRWLIPASAIWGAAVLVLIDLASRTVAGGQEVPLTVFTALIGGPFFLWMLRRNQYGAAR